MHDPGLTVIATDQSGAATFKALMGSLTLIEKRKQIAACRLGLGQAVEWGRVKEVDARRKRIMDGLYTGRLIDLLRAVFARDTICVAVACMRCK